MSNITPYLAKLNAEQRRAATSFDGYNFVLAGAGSGKTSVLVARIACMLSAGINPENILLITFTNKAAKEMKDRVIRLLGEQGSKVTACTFHSFCANVLHKYASLVGMANDFRVLDDGDRSSAMDIAKDDYFAFCEKRGKELNADTFPTNREIFAIYGMVVNNSSPMDEAIEYFAVKRRSENLRIHQDDIKEVIKRFTKYKSEHGAMDYDDLLVYAERLFRQNAKIREEFDNRYKYIMCDEYQDTNPIQNNIINLISQINPNLMVVGDDNQSIYAFRYANVQNILGFKQAHLGCNEFMLTENYRSTQPILDTANAVMIHATEGIPKKLHGQRMGNRPELVQCADSFEEAKWIVADIIANQNKVNLQDVAVVCRSGAQAFILEGLLNKYHVAFNKYGGTKFMEKPVIKDLLAFLQVLHSNKDEIAMTRVLQMFQGIGPKLAKKLSSGIAADGYKFMIDKQWQDKAYFPSLYSLEMTLTYVSTLPLQEQLDYLAHDYYFKIAADRINNSKKTFHAKSEALSKLEASKTDADALMSMTADYKSITSFLTDVVLEATHKDEDTTDKLNVTTIHSAKGLQYHTVYLMDCVEGVFPRCKKGSSEDPEELRCMYVALTRAKERLVLMKPRAVISNNTRVSTSLSHFLDYPNVMRTLNITSVLR